MPQSRWGLSVCGKWIINSISMELFFPLFLLSIWTSDNIFNILFYFLFSAWCLQLHCAAPYSRRKGINSHLIQSFLSSRSYSCTWSVFQNVAAFFKSCSTVFLQLYERERAGTRAAGEDTTGQSQHHHRLFQQGPVVPANTSPCTRHTDTYTHIHTSVVLWAQVGGQNKFYLCIFFVGMCTAAFFLMDGAAQSLRGEDSLKGKQNSSRRTIIGISANRRCSFKKEKLSWIFI